MDNPESIYLRTSWVFLDHYIGGIAPSWDCYAICNSYIEEQRESFQKLWVLYNGFVVT